MKINVSAMPRASLLKDGSQVELEFKTDGPSVTLVFDPDELEQFAARSIELIRAAQTHKRASAGHFEVQASAVVATMADAPVGGGKVILMLKGTNGIVQSFALTPDQSQELRPLLRKAETKAQTDKKQPRH